MVLVCQRWLVVGFLSYQGLSSAIAGALRQDPCNEQWQLRNRLHCLGPEKRGKRNGAYVHLLTINGLNSRGPPSCVLIMAATFWSGIEVCRMVVGIAPRKFTFVSSNLVICRRFQTLRRRKTYFLPLFWPCFFRVLRFWRDSLTC